MNVSVLVQAWMFQCQSSQKDEFSLNTLSYRGVKNAASAAVNFNVPFLPDATLINLFFYKHVMISV